MSNLSRIPYKKPATSYTEQIELLKTRGMRFADEQIAEFYLQHIGYYRLGAYWLPFESNHNTHQFLSNTTFENVLRLYNFDRELRLLVLDAIERIEVSARAQWAHQLGNEYGSHAHLDNSIVKHKEHWQSNVSALHKEIERSEEVFIQHFSQKYSDELPPIWACCEVMSLGLLSRWYSNLYPQHIRNKIAAVFEVDHRVLQSWLHHLSVVRNLCAHHSRLWNRQFDRVSPQAPKNKPAYLKDSFVDDHGLYNTLIIMLHLMNIISPKHRWGGRLRGLLEQHDDLLVSHIKFPTDWKNRNIWKMEIKQ
jgi:abortive infection bacteriophage resistance protein